MPNIYDIPTQDEKTQASIRLFLDEPIPNDFFFPAKFGLEFVCSLREKITHMNNTLWRQLNLEQVLEIVIDGYEQLDAAVSRLERYQQAIPVDHAQIIQDCRLAYMAAQYVDNVELKGLLDIYNTRNRADIGLSELAAISEVLESPEKKELLFKAAEAMLSSQYALLIHLQKIMQTMLLGRAALLSQLQTAQDATAFTFKHHQSPNPSM